MKISEMPADEAAANLYAAYMAHHDAIADGTAEGPHPSKDVSRWREAAAGAAVDAGGLGPVRIQRGGSATDDQQPTETGGIAGEHPTVDGEYSQGTDGVPRFLATDGKVYFGNDALSMRARAGGTSRANRLATEKLIPSLRRLK